MWSINTGISSSAIILYHTFQNKERTTNEWAQSVQIKSNDINQGE